MLRPATTRDVTTIQEILEHYARQGLLLSRSLSDIYDNLRDFVVYQQQENIVAVAALHVCWEDLGEVRSLAVLPAAGRRGIGSRLVAHCEMEARELGLKRIFTLTYQKKFFHRLGFRIVDKSTLPHKVWTDCLKCVKFPNCDEIAMLKELPPAGGS